MTRDFAKALGVMTSRIFLSSTGADLYEHRRVVAGAIGLIDGAECVAMETFGPHEAPPSRVCREKVLGCDLFIGLVGFHRGASPGKGSRSYTESEYLWAAGMERLMWVAPTGAPLPNTEQSGAELDRQREFRRRIIGGTSPNTAVSDKETWNNPYSLANSVLIALFRRLRAPGYTEEQHKAKLRLREREIRAEMEVASQQRGRDREASLRRRAEEISARLRNLESDFASTNASLIATREQLARLDNWIGRERMTQALEALNQGDTRLARRLLREVSKSWQDRIIDPSSQASAVEFMLGKMEEDQGNLSTANDHFALAATLESRNPIYRMKAACSRLALRDPKAAIVYGLQAMEFATADRSIEPNRLIELTYDLAYILSNTTQPMEEVNFKLQSCTQMARSLYGEDSDEYRYFLSRRAECLSGKRAPPRKITCRPVR